MKEPMMRDTLMQGKNQGGYNLSTPYRSIHPKPIKTQETIV
jgi:hypothetical protein